jgi:hypothetical protein
VVWRWRRDSEKVLLDIQKVARLVDGSLECFSEILGGEGVVARDRRPGRRERHGVGHVCVGLNLRLLREREFDRLQRQLGCYRTQEQDG